MLRPTSPSPISITNDPCQAIAVQQSADRQHGIPKRFGFQSPTRHPPAQAVVGIGRVSPLRCI